MNDPKPYTLEDLDKELSPYGGARGDALAHYMGDLEPLRVLATVEALEQERVEYAAEVQRHDETKVALLEARRERDALLALVGQRCDGIECDHAAERICLGCSESLARADAARLREALAALEGLFSYSDTAQCFVVPANARTMPALHRAREALGEVER